MSEFDLIVLGAGATGLGAARAARRLGKRVLLVEAERPGGDCTFFGCVPSKALLETARRVHAACSGEAYGFSSTVSVNFKAVMHRVHQTIEAISDDESPKQLGDEGIDLAVGRASFVDTRTVEVAGKRLTSDRFVIATGANAFEPPIKGLAETAHLTNRTVFALTELPEHLLVLGGGAIGVELAQAFRRLGAKVTIIEALPKILIKEEPEVSEVMTRVLERDGVGIKTGAAVERVSAGPTLHLAGGEIVKGSHLLVAVGRRPNTRALNLAAAGVTVDRDRIVTDDTLRTSASGIFAAGDCTTPLQFTHVGDEQGRLTASNCFATRRARFDSRVIPWVTFTEPEIGHVGLTEEQAFKLYGDRARVAYLPMSAVDRARCAGETDGFVKLIAAPRKFLGNIGGGELVGMTAVGATGGELVAEGALAMQTRAFAGRIAQTVHAYPTWSIAMRIAASQWFGTYGGRTARPARGVAAALPSP